MKLVPATPVSCELFMSIASLTERNKKQISKNMRGTQQ